MGFELGEYIVCRRASEATVYNGKVVSVSDNEFVLKMEKGSLKEISKGKYVIVSDGDSEYYSEITGVDGGLLRLKKMWPEKREHFRIDDVLCVRTQKVYRDATCMECRLLTGFGIDQPAEDYGDGTVNAGLLKMLLSINSKIELILQRLDVSCDNRRFETRAVNLSESGMRLVMDEEVETGDIVEIRMLPPVYPPVGILVYGRVLRVNAAPDGGFEAALQFLDMEDDVRKEISKYTIRRQRTIIRKEKHKAGGSPRR